MLIDELKKIVKGDVSAEEATLNKFSKDASLLSVRPEVVVSPRDVNDIKELVKFVTTKKVGYKNLSIAPRAAGTCMSGGPLTESVVLDMQKYFSGGIKVSTKNKTATVLPGTFYRDFEKETLARDLIMPTYTASKGICAVGGMIGNNSGGEKSLNYGKTVDYVESLKVVLSDGNEYELKALSSTELENKKTQNNFEGEIYRKMFDLVETNRDLIQFAKPRVSKNSAGYNLWDIWNGEKFDLTKLFVGSQGTLGVVTNINFKLVPVKPVSRLLVVFLNDIKPLAKVVNTLLKFKPESLESYDDNTAVLAIKFFPDMMRVLKTGFISMAWSFLPEVGMLLRGGMPKLVLLAEVAGKSDKEVMAKLKEMQDSLKDFKLNTRITKDQNDTNKFWSIRRESFNLLRKHVHGKRTAPFIDDIIVNPEFLPIFLPRLTALLDLYKLEYTIAGHAGNGNFHIIPLMDMKVAYNRELITEISPKVYDLVLEYGGSITAEHNDGLVRTPYLEKMFGPDMTKLFAEVKKIFDPENIFNPGKKVPVKDGPGTFDYLQDHIAAS